MMSYNKNENTVDTSFYYYVFFFENYPVFKGINLAQWCKVVKKYISL